MLLHKNVMHNTSDCSYCTEKENIIGKNLSKVQKVTPKYVDRLQTDKASCRNKHTSDQIIH